MQSSVDPEAGMPSEAVKSPTPEGATVGPTFGVDGALLDRGRGFSSRLTRRLRRQSAAYGPEAARRYLAGLLELDSNHSDIDAEAERLLGAEPGSIRRLIDGRR